MTGKDRLGNIFKASVREIAAFDAAEVPRLGHPFPKLGGLDEFLKAVPRRNLWPIRLPDRMHSVLYCPELNNHIFLFLPKGV